MVIWSITWSVYVEATYMDLNRPCIIRTYIQGTRVSFGINLHLQTIKRTHLSQVAKREWLWTWDMYVLQNYVLPFMERNTLYIIQGPSTGHSRVVGHGSKGKSIDMQHVWYIIQIVHRLGWRHLNVNALTRTYVECANNFNDDKTRWMIYGVYWIPMP